MDALGTYLAQRRTELRLTQREVSERLQRQGIERTSATIAKWELGTQSVPVELLPALARALEMTPVMLYELAGILAELPGSEIVRLTDGLTPEQLAHVERVVRAVVSYLHDEQFRNHDPHNVRR